MGRAITFGMFLCGGKPSVNKTFKPGVCVQIQMSQSRFGLRPGSDDPHYRGNVEILDAKHKFKAWIRQNPATSLLYIEAVFEKAEHIEPGELSPLA
jgi:hypothetical protein